jgi:hypothetical protein
MAQFQGLDLRLSENWPGPAGFKWAATRNQVWVASLEILSGSEGFKNQNILIVVALLVLQLDSSDWCKLQDLWFNTVVVQVSCIKVSASQSNECRITPIQAITSRKCFWM